VTAGAIGARPIAMGIHTQKADGNDLWAVREAAAAAIEHARSGQGPAFLETLTYRFVGHSRSDPGRYRKPGELERWKQRDPLLVARAGLAERYGIEAERCEQIDAEVAAELEQIIEAGLAAPYPEPAAAAAGKEFADA
jgi:TPP-dependent pyruvate/acetoin dehydrogenase alpha subunit